MFRKTYVLLTLSAFLVACPSTEPQGDDGETPRDGGTSTSDPRDGGTITTTPSFLASEKGSVRFKRNRRIQADFAEALGLDDSGVCNELGQYSCADFIHRITLGGVEAYVQGLNEPLPFTSVTTPLAVERMALYACRDRVTADLDDQGNARIFGGLPLANGALSDVEAEAVAAAIQRLYQRALLRNPTPDEVAHHRQLYRDIEADGQPNAARDWAILSCHAVLTSMESLFY